MTEPLAVPPPAPAPTDRHGNSLGPRLTLALIGLVALITLVVAGCRSAQPPAVAQAPCPSPVAPTAPRGELRQAPDFQITVYQGEGALGGSQVSFSSLLRLGKPVVLNFWAGACPPCRAEMPDIQAVHASCNEKVLFFGLDVGPFVGLGSRDEGKALVKELGVTYPVGTTFDASVVREYQILGMPSTFFVTPQGGILRTWTGLLTRGKLMELVGELLAASPSS